MYIYKIINLNDASRKEQLNAYAMNTMHHQWYAYAIN